MGHFQVDRNKNKNSINVFEKGHNQRKVANKSDRLMEGIAEWTSFYRANPHRFVDECLGIKLKLFQQIILWCMFHFTYLAYIASRGQGKSYLVAIYCITRSILYPGSEIVAAAGQKSQAREIVQKMEKERLRSPFIEREIMKLNTSANDPGVTFHNGSTVKVVASTDGSRGHRAHVLIVDEYRLVDIDIINTVLRKFKSATRKPKFLDKPEYMYDDKYQEANQEIYLSSAGFKSEHSYARVESYVNSMTNGENYFVCSIPYQMAIKERLLPRQQVREEMQELTFNEISWMVEMEALFYGQSTKSIFKFEDLQRSRKLLKPFYPDKVSSMINDKKFKIPDKAQGEIRVITADISIIAGKNNDATAITVARLIPRKNGYDREIVHLETLEGGHTGQQALIIKRLKHEFDCDYVVIDRAGGGIGVFDALLEETNDIERGETYPAINCMNDDELAKRCNDTNAIKCLYAIHANAEFNSEIALGLKDALSKGKIILPVTESEGREFLLSNKKYFDLPQEFKDSFMMPFVHATLLVNEIINLEAEINDLGKVKLKEARSARKDRYSSLAYLNHFANYMEQRNKKRKSHDNVDYSKFFMGRKAKRYF